VYPALDHGEGKIRAQEGESMELLFESRLEITRVEGKLYFFQVKPEISPEPVLKPDTFSDGSGASIYGSVLHDGGMYRMWYQAWPGDWDGGDTSLVGYAESDDGISWKKPELGIVDYGGKKNNLCNLGFHSPSVFIDPEAHSTHRYRATGYTRPNRIGSTEVARAGYFTAHSTDGLHWELDSLEPRWEGADVITSVYHPAQQRAIVALKKGPRAGGFPRRSIWNADLIDSRWSGISCALIPDEFDDVGALSRGYASGDYYGMGMMPAGGGTVGFLWQFRHSLPRTADTEAGVFGAVDVSLVYQCGRGDRWLHSFGRKDFISHDDTPWGSGGIYTASCPVEAGDDQRLYFTSTLHSHGWYLDSRWKVQDNRKKELLEEKMCRIGYASWPRDRLFGFKADPDGWLELNLGRIERPVELVLNYKTERFGRVRIELPGRKDYSLDNSRSMVGDNLKSVVEWKTGSIIKPEDENPLIARIHMDCAKLYAFELRSPR
jgi:hypothetical protein